MQLLVFVTDDGRPNGTGPILFLPAAPEAALPPHPRSLTWRYFATVTEDDALLGEDKAAVLADIHEAGHHIANRIVQGTTP